MQYSREEVKQIVDNPEKYKDKYTAEFVEELIHKIYPSEQHAEVRQHLSRIDSIIDMWDGTSKLVEREGYRIHIAALQFSADSSGKGDIKRLIRNIELAEGDYRDLLILS